jgi:hypothetical protein
LFASCETIVDIELPKIKPMIVVNSICTSDKPWRINLTASRNALDNEKLQPIKNAKIEIIGDSSIGNSLIYYKNGTYKTNRLKPKTNINYQLRISADGFETVTSNCIIPKAVQIKNVAIDTIMNEYQRKELKITISFTDTPGIENFYSLKVLRLTTYEGGIHVWPEHFTSNDLLFQNDDNALFENQNKNFGGSEAFFSDEILNGKNYKLTVNVELFGIRDKQNFEVVLNSLSKNYYKYLRTKRMQRETRDNPFAEPVIVYNNIKNGLGIFAGYSSSKYKIE